MAERGLDREMGEIMPREKCRLTAFLSLPGRRPVTSSAAQSRTAVSAFLHCDGQQRNARHADYLMKRFAFLQHFQESFEAPGPRFRFLRRMKPPENRVTVRGAQRFEEISCRPIFL